MRRVHRGWVVAAVAAIAIVGAAGFRATPGVLIIPLQDEFGWDRGTISLAVSVNLLLYGLTAPFAAALMDRFGVRRVVAFALVLVATGSALTTQMNQPWQLVLCWGVLVGLGTGSMALVFAATIANRWFHERRGLVTGILTAAGATGQLVFLPVLAALVDDQGWRAASWTVAGAALAVVPLVLLAIRERPSDVGLLPYGAMEPAAPVTSQGSPARQALSALRSASPPARSGSSRGASSSAARPPTAWSAPTSSPPPTTTGFPRRPPPACSRSSVSSTSSGRSGPAT
jgi:MFS family permease